ncbi:MAG: hypothetical protein V1799_18550 [bacterium]
MTDSQQSHIFLLYSARHQQCGHYIERVDYRISSKEDLVLWTKKLNIAAPDSVLSLHCDKCSKDFMPTHVRVIEDTHLIVKTLVPEIEIKKFNPADWILKIR